jgi:hypothetical protein
LERLAPCFFIHPSPQRVARVPRFCAPAMLAHGQIRSMKEVHDNLAAMHGTSVRVMGVLRSFDPDTSTAVVEADGLRLVVDLSLVPGGDPHRVGSSYQYIGELEVGTQSESKSKSAPPTLRARVARNVDGLDQEVYRRALQVRRKFLAGK